MNELVRPASIILTHTNEAVTEQAKLRPSSRTAMLVKQLKAPVHLALSGRTMEFDSPRKVCRGLLVPRFCSSIAHKDSAAGCGH